MLAKRYKDQMKKVSYPCFVQPKLNGVRGLYAQGMMQSRDENYWNDSVVAQFTRELQSFIPHDIVLDGEFYLHGMSLQRINSAISINRTDPTPQTESIQYHVFDCILINDLDAPFSKRTQALAELIGTKQLQHTFLVNTQQVYDSTQAEQFYAHFRRQLYEGMMYRANAPYGLTHNCGNKENRWDVLLKRKEWLDDEFLIIGIQEGTGKYEGSTGSLLLQARNGATFTAGSGLSDIEREQYYNSPPIGLLARIKYEMLSDSGIPLKPTVEAVFE